VPLEEPPSDLSGFPAVFIDEGVVLARIHRTGREPVYFSAGGGGRFDIEPEGTLYLARTEEGAFLEVFRSRLVPSEEVAARKLASIRLREKWRLADLTSPACRGFGVTAAVHATPDSALCQRWATALRAAGFDGILDRLSHDPSGEAIGIALFGPVDETVARLTVEDDRPIGDDLVERIRTRFGVLVLPTKQPG
jgi:hypothetical protein